MYIQRERERERERARGRELLHWGSTAGWGVGGDHGELLPWHYTYEGSRGRWGTPTMALECGGDDGELRPWHYIYEGRRGRWGTPTMALHILMETQRGGGVQ